MYKCILFLLLPLMDCIADVSFHLDNTELVQLIRMDLIIHLSGQHTCVQ